MAMMNGDMRTDFFENGSLDLARESEFDAPARPEIDPEGFSLPTLVINLLLHLWMVRKTGVGAYYQVYGAQKLLEVSVLLTLYNPLPRRILRPERS